MFGIATWLGARGAATAFGGWRFGVGGGRFGDCDPFRLGNGFGGGGDGRTDGAAAHGEGIVGGRRGGGILAAGATATATGSFGDGLGERRGFGRGLA